MIDRISSKDNKRIKNLKLLSEKHTERKKQALFVIEGLKMVNEAIELGLTKEVYLSESFFSSLEEEKAEGSLKQEREKLKSFLPRLEVFVVSEPIFKSISDTVSPQGILALSSTPNHDISLLKRKEKQRLLVLENIKDPGNLGTMVRTAEAAGMTALILSKNTVDILNPKVVRSTMGSIFRLPYFYVSDLSNFIREARVDGYFFYATHLEGKIPYNELCFEEKSAVVIGNEAQGLSDEIASLCHQLTFIPMEGKVESLNAAIAAALMMYRMMD